MIPAIGGMEGSLHRLYPNTDMQRIARSRRDFSIGGLTGNGKVPGMSLPDAEAVRELVVAHEGLHNQFLDAGLSTKDFDHDQQQPYNNAAEALLQGK
jgi:hypothetical protein